MRKSSLDGVGVDGASNGKDGSGGSILDSSDLVANGSKDVGEEDDQIGLDGSGNLGVRGNGLDSDGGTLTGESVLLVGELLLETLDDPAKAIVSVSGWPLTFFVGAAEDDEFSAKLCPAFRKTSQRGKIFAPNEGEG